MLLPALRSAPFRWPRVPGRLGPVTELYISRTLRSGRAFTKQGAAATYKRGFGFHPLGAWCANTGEALAMLLRPGNAGSNTASDHLAGAGPRSRRSPQRSGAT